MISYGGEILPTPTEEASAWVEKNISLSSILHFSYLHWPGTRRLSWPFPAHVSDERVRLGVLSWPTGASRFASIHLLVTEEQLSRIRPKAYSPTATNSYQSLTLQLGSKKTIDYVETSLFMLPARPLAVPAGLLQGEHSLWLLTLVDVRFFWWERAASIVITPGTTTWASLFTSLGTGLNETITTDTIDADYLKPGNSLTARYEYLPLLLDAACVNVGMRLVRSLNGTVTAQLPTTARTNHVAQLKKWRKQAGGQFELDPLSQPHDFGGLVPKQVTVTFPQTSGGVPTSTPHTATVTLLSLVLTEYPAGFTGHYGDKVFHDTATYTGSNGAEITALATEIARDWYRWQVGRQDVKFASIVPYAPEGLTDRIEWTFSDVEISTRVLRGPWNDLNENMNHNSTATVGGGGSGTGGSFDICCGWAIYDSLNLMKPLYDIDLNDKDILINTGTSNLTIATGATFNVNIGSGSFFNFINTGTSSNFTFDGDIGWLDPLKVWLVSEVCPEYVTDQDYLSSDHTGITSTTAVDVTGVAIVFTLTAAVDVLVWGVFDFEDGDVGSEWRGFVSLQPTGSAAVDYETPHARYMPLIAAERKMGTQVWHFPALAPGEYTVRLRIRKVAGTGTLALNAASTTLTVHADTVIVAEKKYLYLPNGTLVNTTSCVRNVDTCCDTGSGGGTGSGSVFDCVACDAAPATYRATWASVANGTCAGCTGYNAAFNLVHSTGCSWVIECATPTDECNPTLTCKTLSYVAVGDYWKLVVSDPNTAVTIVEYRLAGVTWNCLGNNTMTKQTENGYCSWPATVLVAAI